MFGFIDINRKYNLPKSGKVPKCLEGAIKKAVIGTDRIVKTTMFLRAGMVPPTISLHSGLWSALSVWFALSAN